MRPIVIGGLGLATVVVAAAVLFHQSQAPMIHDVTSSSMFCERSQHQLDLDRANPATKAVLWRLARHYGDCINDKRETMFWLKKLADQGDVEAKVEFDAWAQVEPRVDHGPGVPTPANSGAATAAQAK